MPATVMPVFTGMTIKDLTRISFPTEEEVHVWQIPVAAAVREGLNETESARAARFHQSADADRFTSARRALRQLACAYTGIPPTEIIIDGDARHKPVFGNKAARALHFNVSHSGAVILIAFGGRPVGIDTEAIDRNFVYRDLLPDHFSMEEHAAIEAAPDAAEAFYRLWTRKEALVKGRGTGLRESLAQLAVLEDFPVSGTGEEPWRLLSFIVDSRSAAALACNVSSGRIVFYRAI